MGGQFGVKQVDVIQRLLEEWLSRLAFAAPLDRRGREIGGVLNRVHGGGPDMAHALGRLGACEPAWRRLCPHRLGRQTLVAVEQVGMEAVALDLGGGRPLALYERPVFVVEVFR